MRLLIEFMLTRTSFIKVIIKYWLSYGCIKKLKLYFLNFHIVLKDV